MHNKARSDLGNAAKEGTRRYSCAGPSASFTGIRLWAGTANDTNAALPGTAIVWYAWDPFLLLPFFFFRLRFLFFFPFNKSWFGFSSFDVLTNVSYDRSLSYDYGDMYIWPFLYIIYHTRGGWVSDGKSSIYFYSVSQSGTQKLLLFSVSHFWQALYILYF